MLAKVTFGANVGLDTAHIAEGIQYRVFNES